MSEGGAPAPSVRVERIEVHRGHLICRASFPDAPRTTSPQLMRRVLAAFPSLPRHACVNELGTSFGAVMDCTPLPHLLEHLVIDLQVRAQAGSGAAAGAADAPLVGTSEWVDERAGVARIDVSFADDLVALRALRDAVAFLNQVLDATGTT